MQNINLFIIWEHARHMSDQILLDMAKEFKILKIYEVSWTEKEFSKNLTRFYGENLPKNSHKEKHCGIGSFYLIVVNDEKADMSERMTSRGLEFVNTHMFDCKAKYREWTGGGHKIHGTNSEVETNHDLTLLIGKNINDFLEDLVENPWNGEVIAHNTDLIGSISWNSLEEVFYMLNNCSEYAVLRNHEDLFGDTYLDGHEDIDIICNNKENMKFLLNCDPVFKQGYRVHYTLQVLDKKIAIDLRFVGDNYYDFEWQESMLNNRIYNPLGFYQLNDVDYYYSLMYHALIHKLHFGFDYERRLIEMSKGLKLEPVYGVRSYIKELEQFLIENNYNYTVPLDSSVLFNKDSINIQLIKNNHKKDLRRIVQKIKSKLVSISGKLSWKMYLKHKLLSEKEFFNCLNTYGIVNIERYCYNNWKYGNRYYTGLKGDKKVFLKAKDTYNTYQAEINAHSALNNENNYYLNIVEHNIDDKNGFVAFDFETFVTLEEFLSERNKFDKDTMKEFVEFAIINLEQLNKCNIIHRDIRPANIALKFNEKKELIGFKLFDFGMAIQNRQDHLNSKNRYQNSLLRGLGNEYKFSTYIYDDAAAFIRIIEEIDCSFLEENKWYQEQINSFVGISNFRIE